MFYIASMCMHALFKLQAMHLRCLNKNTRKVVRFVIVNKREIVDRKIKSSKAIFRTFDLL